MVLGIYFYRKQRALATKPPAPYRDRNANGSVAMVGGYAATGVYHTTAPPNNNNGVPPRTAGINTRPPPPIQMYSMDEPPHAPPPSKRHLRGMEPRPFMTRLMMIILRVELLGIVGATGIILAPSRMVPFMPMEVT